MNSEGLYESVIMKHGRDPIQELESVSTNEILEALLRCLSVEKQPLGWSAAPVSGFAPGHADVKCGANFIALGSKVETARLLALAPRMAATIMRLQAELDSIKQNNQA